MILRQSCDFTGLYGGVLRFVLWLIGKEFILGTPGEILSWHHIQHLMSVWVHMNDFVTHFESLRLLLWDPTIFGIPISNVNLPKMGTHERGPYLDRQGKNFPDYWFIPSCLSEVKGITFQCRFERLNISFSPLRKQHKGTYMTPGLRLGNNSHIFSDKAIAQLGVTFSS